MDSLHGGRLALFPQTPSWLLRLCNVYSAPAGKLASWQHSAGSHLGVRLHPTILVPPCMVYYAATSAGEPRDKARMHLGMRLFS